MSPRMLGSTNKLVEKRVGSCNITSSDPLGNFVLLVFTTLDCVGLEAQHAKGSTFLLGNIERVSLNYSLLMSPRHFRLLCPGTSSEEKSSSFWPGPMTWAAGGAKAFTAQGVWAGRKVHKQVIHLVPLGTLLPNDNHVWTYTAASTWEEYDSKNLSPSKLKIWVAPSGKQAINTCIGDSAGHGNFRVDSGGERS